METDLKELILIIRRFKNHDIYPSKSFETKVKKILKKYKLV